MEVQAGAVPLVLLHVAVPVLGVPALALAARALEVQVPDALAPEVLHVAVRRVPVQDLRIVVQVLGVLALVQVAPTPGALTPVVTLEIPTRVDIQGPTLAAPTHRDTRVTQILGATQGLVLVAPAHEAIPILTQAAQDLRVTLILIQVIPTRRVIQTRAQAIPTRKVIQTRAQAVLITTTATATITITTITMTTTTTTTITTAMTTARD